jgi:hypothetical protein
VLIDGPFLVLAGRPLISMVIVDQVGRASGSRVGLLSRVSDLTMGNVLVRNGSTATLGVIAVVGALLVAAMVALALSVPAGRLPGVLFLVQLAVLLAAPVYLWFYADYAMPALCLAAGAAVHALQARRPARRRSAAAAGAALIVLSAIVFVRIEVTNPPSDVLAAPGAAATRATAGARCVQSTSPMPLILLNVLSRDFQNGCRQWVDVSGRTYGVDRSPTNQPRTRNRRWQRDVLRYLLAGQQYVLVDVKREGLDRRTMAVLRTGPVIARSRGFVLRARVPGQLVGR